MNKLRTLSLVMAVLAGGLVLCSLRLPLWHMRMEAPQYRGSEALKVVVRPGSLEGDLSEIKLLNHYIGLTIPDRLPQTRWLPATLCFAAALGLIAVLLPARVRRFAVLAAPAVLAGAMLLAAGQAQWQMYRIGHDRDPHPILEGIKDFTPPLLGCRKLAQFELTSGFGLGSLCIAGAVGLYAAIGWLAREKVRVASQPSKPRPRAVAPPTKALQPIL